MTHLEFNAQAYGRVLIALCRMPEGTVTVLGGEVIEPGYCLDAPNDLPAGSLEGISPSPAKRPRRNWVSMAWVCRP
ncbi:MAG: hypothetical protein RJA99_4270 [Pseudomonadota bacterium]|jgi:hypothetical protein